MESPDSSISFLRFNQDATSLALGSSSGYKLFTLSSLDRLEPLFCSGSECDVRIVERLFSSSLLALVTHSAPRKLKVCHFKKGTEICNYKYASSILSVRLNRARLVVCLEEALFIHNIRDMKIVHTIKETPANKQGLCALAVNSNDNCYLAYPGSSSTGEVQLFDALNLHSKIMIPAHDAPLAALAFDSSGTRLATASERGTVIRMFSVEDGTKIAEFRRGVKRCATIQSLAFSNDDNFLILSSNTETIHVFRCDEENKQEEPQPKPQQSSKEESGWMGYLSKAVSTTANYLPAHMTETLNQTRSFATITLSSALPGSAVAMTTISKHMRILIAATDGYLYIYNLPGAEGGECMLMKQHRIDADCSRATLSEPDSSSPIAVRQQPSDDDDQFKPSSIGEEENVLGPAVLPVTHHQSHSPQSQDSPPPMSHMPET